MKILQPLNHNQSLKNITTHKLILTTVIIFMFTAGIHSISIAQDVLLTDLKICQINGTTQVKICADNEFPYETFSLSAPPQIVIDCINTIQRVPTQQVPEFQSDVLQKIRVNQFKQDPPVVRIVLDLQEKVEYSVEDQEKCVILTLLNTNEHTSVEMKKEKNNIDATQLITMDLEDADIKTVLRSLAEITGMNIVAGTEITGTVTLRLNNVPPRQMLDAILKANNYVAVEEDNVIRITTFENYQAEKLRKESLERKKEELATLSTEVFKVYYAKAAELKSALTEILSKRGNIQVDTRTNTLIVTDIPDNLIKIEQLIRTLDSKTPQVEIDAKLVEIDSKFCRELGIQWDITQIQSGAITSGEAHLEGTGVFTPAGRFLSGVISQSWGNLEAILTALESQDKAKIISNPKITTADNHQAMILAGKKVPLIVMDEAGNPITRLTDVGIKLTCTPHVNSDNTITLDLHPEVSDLSGAATVAGGIIILTSEATTRVIVDNGQTAVIGGLVSEKENETRKGLPIFSSIPILGSLFEYRKVNIEKTDLLIFVTPRIIPTE